MLVPKVIGPVPAGRGLPARPDAPTDRFQVANPGGGHRHHPGPGDPRPPRQVEILPELINGGVEAPQGLEEIGTHQGGPTRGDEDLAHAVVLVLVELTPLDQILDHTHLVSRGAHREQPVRLVPPDVLRGHDPRVGTVGLLDQVPDGIRRQHHVVMTEEQMGCPVHVPEHLVGRPAETDPTSETHHVGAREHGRHPGRRVRLAGRIDHEHRQIGVVLVRQGTQPLLQPGPGITGYDDRHHRGGRQLRFGDHPEPQGSR